MTAQKIINILGEEVQTLHNKGHLKVAIALGEFIINSTDEELIRFAELIKKI